MPGPRGLPAVTITSSDSAVAAGSLVPITRLLQPSTAADWSRSSAIPWGRPSSTSIRTISRASSFSAHFWAVIMPTCPAPTTVMRVAWLIGGEERTPREVGRLPAALRLLLALAPRALGLGLGGPELVHLRRHRREQPGVEEGSEVAPGDLRRVRHEAVRAAVLVVVARDPLLQRAEEGLVPDLGPQTMEHHRAARVDPAAEDALDARVEGRGGLAPAQAVVGLAHALLIGLLAADVLLPQPLGVAREALVEPHVAPQVRADAVAEPLVGELVHDHLEPAAP